MTLPVHSARPPNYEKVVRVFPKASQVGTIFTYGRAIYCLKGADGLDPSLFAHEQVHSDRQIAMGVEAWWDRYLVDNQFRFDEELAAHIVEYEHFAGRGRNERKFYLRQIARRLAGPLYGHMVTVDEAKRMILKGCSHADQDNG